MPENVKTGRAPMKSQLGHGKRASMPNTTTTGGRGAPASIRSGLSKGRTSANRRGS